MGPVGRGETIEQWAARAVSRLDAYDWSDINAHGTLWDEEDAAAFRAHRDKVASGLSRRDSRILVHLFRVALWSFTMETQRALGGLMHEEQPAPGDDQRTDFGREIARVLEAS